MPPPGASVALLAGALLACAAARPAVVAAPPAAPPRPAFIKGVDASAIGSLDCDGACPKFRWDATSPPSDAVQQLARAGVNTVRIRLWNNPSPPFTYSNLTGVLALARRVTDAGMAVWLDFHYSDTWADPGHQAKPAAWAGLAFPDLVAAVHNFTFSAVTALVAQGTPPYVVQTGNEIDGEGMLVNGGSQPCADGGRISGSCAGNWAAYGQLVAAGQAAVRAASPSTLLAIQSYRGGHLGLPGGAGVSEIQAFFSALVKAGGGDFDVASFSFYPESAPCPCNVSVWQQLEAVQGALPPGARVAIAETSYPWQDNTHGLKPGQFPYTQDGQAAYVRAAVAQMGSIKNGLGVVWWGTEIVDGYGLGLTALWDENYVGTEALRTGWQ